MNTDPPESEHGEFLISSHEVRRSDLGTIYRIVFSGKLPDGSEGNVRARRMTAAVENIIEHIRPAAIILDLTELKYEWGDAIGGIMGPIFQRQHAGTPLAACIIARGKTADGLRSLRNSASGSLFELTETEIFEELKDGHSYVESKVGPR